MPMNPEYKAPWLAALRSGEFKQTKSVLYDGNGYCCLGVLCKVAGSSFYHSNADDEDEYEEPRRYEPTDLKGDPPGDYENLNDHGRLLFGLTLDDGAALTVMNDGGTLNHGTSQVREIAPHSFSQIADWIEENL